MRIALLGATSQIARDLILSFDVHGRHELTLYGRRPAVIADWLQVNSPERGHVAAALSDFGPAVRFDAIFNFVGVSDPAAIVALGADIFKVTAGTDDMAMSYLEARPDCRYFFLSSGAAYCFPFHLPAADHTRMDIDLNNVQSRDWYGLAKMQAECRHRARPSLPIVDLRVFSYFSRTQDMQARFLLADALRSIRKGAVLKTTREQNFRDYLHPSDFHALVECMLVGSPANTALDCYTLAPVQKSTLLDALRDRFSLQFEVAGGDAAVNGTGLKTHYYSLNRRAADFGYVPSLSSLEGVLMEVEAYLDRVS